VLQFDKQLIMTKYATKKIDYSVWNDNSLRQHYMRFGEKCAKIIVRLVAYFCDVYRQTLKNVLPTFVFLSQYCICNIEEQ